MLPVNLAKPLERHLQKIKAQHEEDLEAGFGTVYLPGAIERKSPNAASEWAWQHRACRSILVPELIRASRSSNATTRTKVSCKMP